ncbi:kinesin light chain 3 [Macroventuria anomochaeta]|uniref:Kinesin light chain 3 n=1 Tax=Macroventuria anomochaeta TaxID=301207 RepID=A0ACB6SH45_9PLEO|nr:kinesin light chain 3 [Macroventuria anomochaeta]KAF2633298.1 kinesin light chain 3 [Macroventuria anomochaeta]
MHCLTRLPSLSCRIYAILLSPSFASLLPQARPQAATAMRLLHFDELERPILTDFRSKSIPPYAILSHRWSDSEVLIEDVSNGIYKKKEDGYRKLRFCAGQAAKDGLQYSWIDTCCIDRWDNNERSRAINSMFQWYRNAARCYVFLSDVSLTAVTETATAPCSDWEAAFCASAWFNRGWTLQELIAPVSVEFFSREGQRIGDKASLEQLIHSTTGIRLEALRGSPLDQFSTSERMRWAENRTTTEEEDIVYCLLGLLGISMPITYGEGQESARRRLQAEISANGSAPSIIPFSRNESFVGRELQLAELEAKLFSNEQTTTRLAIVGPGGTGKSQLALEVAHRARLNNKDCSVFWMDATDTDSLYQSYASVAQKSNIPGCEDEQADIKQVVKRCVAAISARQCLLILDNAEGTTVRPSGLSSSSEAAPLADFLPHSKLCSVIFTTTESNTAEALAPRNVTALHELTPDTALRMLQNRLTTPLSDAEQQEAMHLLEELSYLPLAVVQAAACMNTSGMTVQQYQAELAEHKAAVPEYSDDSCEAEVRESGLRKTVAATLSLSISQIRQSNAIAADYLFLAACVDRNDISLDLLEAASRQAREDAIKVLDRYALITRRPAVSALDVHRLVHYALRKSMEAEGRLQEWIQRTVSQLLRVFPNDDHSNRSKWRRLLPHARYVLSHTQRDDDKERLDLARKCAMALYSDGQYNRAEKLQVEVMQTSKRVLGDEHPDTLTSIANLASTYMKQGRWSKAEKLEVEVMKTSKRVLGDEHPHTLTSTANLASTYRNQGRWGEAEKLEVEAMKTKKRVLGDEHPSTLISIANLASTYWNQGRWGEAEKLNVEVMQTRKRVLGDEHPDTLTSIANLASTYRNQGRWVEAEKLQVQDMETTKRVLGDEHPDTLLSIANLASTYRNQGRWGKAEKLEVEVMKTSKRVLGDEHPHTLTSTANLASTYRDQGRWVEAEKLEVEVMQTRKRVLGDEHPHTLTSIANLASTYRNQGRWGEAEKLEVEVMQTRKRVLGDEHPHTLLSIANLASTYRNQGRWVEAEKLNVEVMKTSKRVLGDEHPDTLTSIANLASTYWRQGRWDEAEKLNVEVMKTSKRVLGDEHPHTLTSIANLASTYWRQGRWDEAEKLNVEVMQTRTRVLGNEHPSTLTSTANLASTYRNQGRWDEAEKLEVEVMQTRKRVLGDEHPSTLTSMHNLAYTLWSKSRHIEAIALIEICFQLRRKVLGEQHPDAQLSLKALNGWRGDAREEQ